MRILYISSRLPFPLDKGDKVRDYYHIKGLSERGHSIILLSLIQNKEERKYVSELELFCEKVITIYHPRYKSFLSAAMAIFNRYPFQVQWFWSRDMVMAVDRLITKKKIDLIYTHLIRMARYTIYREKTAKVIDLADAISKNLSRRAETTSLFLKPLVSMEKRRVEKFENKCIGTYSKAFIVAEGEKDYLNHEMNRVEVIKMGVLLGQDRITSRTGLIEAPKLIFTGNMGYHPNVDAVVHFAKDIFPLIREKYPKTEFSIVGASPSKSVRSLNGNGVVVKGRVESIFNEMERSDILVAPMRQGTGVQNKILEAMSSMLPVVTTPLGNAGIGAVEGKMLLVAETPEEFAEQVFRVLENTEERHQMVQAAKQFILANHAWNSVVGSLEQKLYEAVKFHNDSINQTIDSP